MKQMILSLTAAVTFAACSTPSKNPAISRATPTAPTIPTNSMAMTQEILQREISGSISELKTLPLEDKQLHKIKTRLEQADAALKDLHRGTAIIIKENEMLSKQQVVHLKEIEAITGEKKKTASRLERVTLQRNWLAAAILGLSASFIGIFLGPKIIKFIINLLKW